MQHEEFWKHEYHTDFDKMQLVIDISRKNVSFNSGGPFGAAIFNKTTNKLVSVGMSLVEHSGPAAALKLYFWPLRRDG